MELNINLLDQSEIKLDSNIESVQLLITSTYILIIHSDFSTLIPLSSIKTADIPNDMIQLANSEEDNLTSIDAIHGKSLKDR